MNIEAHFIEVKRATRDKSGSNVVRDETIKIKDIKSFRPWFKTAKEDDIKGELTMLIMEDDANVQSEVESKEKRNTLLICESYNDFVLRMRSFVIIK